MEKKHFLNTGFTLIEVLVVVAIIGILSAAGYSSLNSAIANNRLKDAIVNTRAFVEMMSSESKRLNDSLCIKFKTKTITAYKYSGSNCKGDALDSRNLDGAITFYADVSTSSVSSVESFIGTPSVWSKTDEFFILSPEQGLNNVNGEGIIALRYGSSDRMGAVVKTGKKNRWQTFFSVDGGASWVTP